jgi:hypothetical protein
MILGKKGRFEKPAKNARTAMKRETLPRIWNFYSDASTGFFGGSEREANPNLHFPSKKTLQKNAVEWGEK